MGAGSGRECFLGSIPGAASACRRESGALNRGHRYRWHHNHGLLRSRAYFWNWFQGATGENQYEYSGNLLRVAFSQKLRSWDWNIELAVPFLLGLPSNATNPAPQGALGLGSNYYTANQSTRNTAMIFPKQLYVRLHPFNESQTIQAGRFTFSDGAETAPRNAAAEFQKILDHSGLVWNCWTGALARLGVARANALAARNSHGADADAARVRAIAAYKDFLSLLKDADSDVPVYGQAKAEYAKLQ